MGKQRKRKIRTNVELKYVASDQFMNSNNLLINNETGEHIGDAFAYGRKKGRADPRQVARQSRLYGIGSNIYASAASGLQNVYQNNRQEYINNRIISFKNGNSNKIEFNAKDLKTAQNTIIRLIGGSFKGYQYKNFMYIKTSGNFKITIKEIKLNKYKVTILRAR